MYRAMSHDLKIVDALLLGLGLAFGLWLFYCALKRSESPLKIIYKGLLTLTLVGGELYVIHRLNDSLQEGAISTNATWVLCLVASVAAAGVIMSIIWTPHIAGLLASPLTDIFDGGSQPPERRPAYSAAISKRRQDHPLEAIVAIREQLALFPNDFQGVMLLASIQAEDMNDLPSAEITLRRFGDTPGVPEEQAAKALRQLAEWHFEKGSDDDTVLEIMEDLITRFPDAKISRKVAERLGRTEAGTAGQKAALGVKPVISFQVGGRKHISIAHSRTPHRS